MCGHAWSLKLKLGIYQPIYAPALTFSLELWVMTERMKLQILAFEISFSVQA